jgi:hypothetical protein
MLDVLENWRVMAPRRVAAGPDLEDMSLLDSLDMLAMRVVCVVQQERKVQIGKDFELQCRRFAAESSGAEARRLGKRHSTVVPYSASRRVQLVPIPYFALQ